MGGLNYSTSLPSIYPPEVLASPTMASPAAKSSRKHRKSKQDDDCLVVDGGADVKELWPPQAFLRLMEYVEEDFLNNLLDGGGIKKPNFMRYASRLQLECNVTVTWTQCKWKVNGVKTKWNA